MLTTTQIRAIEETTFPVMQDAIDLHFEYRKLERQLNASSDLTDEEERAGEKRLENLDALISYRSAKLDASDDIFRALGYTRDLKVFGTTYSLKEGSIFTKSTAMICGSIATVAAESYFDTGSWDEAAKEKDRLFAEYKQAIEAMISEKEQAC